jgi:hypothetical protein
MRLSDVRLSSPDLDAEGERPAARVPDDASRRLGGDHRDRVGVDHARPAQVARARGATRLLVADEVEDDLSAVKQPER